MFSPLLTQIHCDKLMVNGLQTSCAACQPHLLRVRHPAKCEIVLPLEQRQPLPSSSTSLELAAVQLAPYSYTIRTVTENNFAQIKISAFDLRVVHGMGTRPADWWDSFCFNCDSALEDGVPPCKIAINHGRAAVVRGRSVSPKELPHPSDRAADNAANKQGQSQTRNQHPRQSRIVPYKIFT